MSSTKGLAGADLIEGPATVTGAGGGTVTSVTGTLPIVSSGGAAPNISINNFAGGLKGAVPPSDQSPLKYLSADGTFTIPAPGTGAFVRLQAATPGTVDTGNFQVSGVGIVGTQVLVGETAATVSGLSLETIGGNARIAAPALLKLFLTGSGAGATDGSSIRFGNNSGEDRARIKLGGSGSAAPFTPDALCYVTNNATPHSFFAHSLLRFQVESESSSTVFGASVRAGTHHVGELVSVPLWLVGQDVADAFSNVSIESFVRATGAPAEFRLRHGATTAIGLGTEKMRVTEQFANPNTQIVFGDVAGWATAATGSLSGTLGQFQVWFDATGTPVMDLHSPVSDTGITQLALYAPNVASGGNTDGIHLVARANVAGNEDGAITFGTLDRILLPGGAFTDSTDVIFAGGSPGVSDSQKSTLTWQATDTASHTSAVSWGIELPGDGVSPGDLVGRTGAGVESLRYKPEYTSLWVNAANDGGNYSGVVLQSQGYFAWDNGAAGPGPWIKAFGDATSGSILLFGGLTVGPPNSGVIASISVGGTDTGLDVVSTSTFPAIHGESNGGAGDALVGNAGSGRGIFASSLSGISALFQTSAVDGSNTNETLALKGNTAQVSPLLKCYGADATTPVMVTDIDGNISIIRGVPLVWPVANAAGVLTNDGAGNLAWV